MKQGMTLTELASEVERQAATKMDFIASTDNLSMQIDPVHFPGEKAAIKAVPRLAVSNVAPGPLAGDIFDIGTNAHAQIANRLDIGKRYYDRMKDEAPHLLAQNVNHWFHEKPSRRMIRTLDGRARAYLTDSYQRRDNFELMTYLLPTLTAQDEGGVSPWSFHSQSLTEDYIYLKMIHVNAAAITTKRGVDDVVHAGIVITNSEVGLRALRIEPLIWWKWCLNGAIASRYSQRKVHLGKKHKGEDPVEVMLSDETKRLEDEAFFSKAKDVIAHFANPDTFQKIVGEITETTDREITGKVEKGVTVLSNMLGLQSEETEGVLRNLINNSDRYGLTQYGLLNAVTRTAQDVESYDRAYDLESAADKVIDLSPSQWREISEAA